MASGECSCSTFVGKIIVPFSAHLAAKRIVQTGDQSFAVKPIRIFVDVKLSGTHSTANLMLVLVSHDGRRSDRQLMFQIDVRTSCFHVPSSVVQSLPRWFSAKCVPSENYSALGLFVVTLRKTTVASAKFFSLWRSSDAVSEDSSGWSCPHLFLIPPGRI